MKRNRTLDTCRTALHIWIDDPHMSPLQAYRRAVEAERIADEVIGRLLDKYREETEVLYHTEGYYH